MSDTKEWFEETRPLLCLLGIHKKSKWCPDTDRHQWAYCLRCLKSYLRIVRNSKKLPK